MEQLIALVVAIIVSIALIRITSALEGIRQELSDINDSTQRATKLVRNHLIHHHLTPPEQTNDRPN